MAGGWRRRGDHLHCLAGSGDEWLVEGSYYRDAQVLFNPGSPDHCSPPVFVYTCLVFPSSRPHRDNRYIRELQVLIRCLQVGLWSFRGRVRGRRWQEGGVTGETRVISLYVSLFLFPKGDSLQLTVLSYCFYYV